MNPGLVLAPLCVFVAFCLADIARAEQVRRLPRWAWAIISLNVLGGIIYLLVGRVPARHEYRRGYRAATSTMAAAGDVAWPALGDPASEEFDLRRWAATQQSALRAAATGTAPFRLPAWFTQVADDLGSLLDPVGFDRWSFTPTDPFVRGYQAGLLDARATAASLAAAVGQANPRPVPGRRPGSPQADA
jgi:hypothetical protein